MIIIREKKQLDEALIGDLLSNVLGTLSKLLKKATVEFSFTEYLGKYKCECIPVRGNEKGIILRLNAHPYAFISITRQEASLFSTDDTILKTVVFDSCTFDQRSVTLVCGNRKQFLTISYI